MGDKVCCFADCLFGLVRLRRVAAVFQDHRLNRAIGFFFGSVQLGEEAAADTAGRDRAPADRTQEQAGDRDGRGAIDEALATAGVLSFLELEVPIAVYLFLLVVIK